MDSEIHDILWKQWFTHFRKAFSLLEQNIAIADPSDAERAGLIHSFEMSFELAWKVLKDYLEEEGLTVVSPRDAMKQAFQLGLIMDGHIWQEIFEDRRLMVHTYEKTIAISVEKKIRERYFPALAQLFRDFSFIWLAGQGQLNQAQMSI